MADINYDSMTFDSLQAALRLLLNDATSSAGEGNYSDAEIRYYINSAYTDTQVWAKCNTLTLPILTVANQSIYSCAPLFEILYVSIAGKELDKATIGKLSIKNQAFNDAAAGVPMQFVRIAGGKIQLFPAPATAGLTITVIGYGVSPKLAEPDDTADDAIPIGLGRSLLMARAESKARAARSSYDNNMSLSESLKAEWASGCQMLAGTVQSG